MTKSKDSKNSINAATCLLLSIAYADEKLKEKEISVVKEIISDFFSLSKESTDSFYIDAIDNIKKSTDLFKFGKILNDEFTYQDKLDFIGCIFEVAFIDGELHYIENHRIKLIANILNLDHTDLIKSKMEIKRFL